MNLQMYKWQLELILPRRQQKRAQRNARQGEGAKGGADTMEASAREKRAKGNDPMPKTISPMLATGGQAFSDPQWLFELKVGWLSCDGIHRKRKRFRFLSRRKLDLIDKFPQAESIPA